MIDWSKYFDHIFCIHYISENRIRRHEQLINELSRVGIYQSGIFSFIYDTDNKFSNIIYDNKELLDRFKCLDYDRNSKYALRVTINHLQALNISKLLKYDKVLILEDDVCFLKDLNQIENILENNVNSLNNYNLCLYDWIGYSVDQFKDMMYVYADCYAVNTEGINILIDNITNNPNSEIYTIDNYFNRLPFLQFYCGNYYINITLPKLLNITTSKKRIALQRNDPSYNDLDINYDEYENFYDKN